MARNPEEDALDVDIYKDGFYCFTVRRQLWDKKIPKSVFEVIDI
jgi:hypothetical protein